jgi:hypothetical protein
MNDKTCNDMMDTFFALDKHERYPLKLTLHLLACPKCRTQVRLCTIAERVCAEPLKRNAREEEVDALAAKIRSANPNSADVSPISLRRWIVSGVTMILAMMVFTVISPRSAGNHLQLAFYLVFGCVVTAYCSVFIASNIDFFVKKTETMMAG